MRTIVKFSLLKHVSNQTCVYKSAYISLMREKQQSVAIKAFSLLFYQRNNVVLEGRREAPPSPLARRGSLRRLQGEKRGSKTLEVWALISEHQKSKEIKQLPTSSTRNTISPTTRKPTWGVATSICQCSLAR